MINVTLTKEQLNTLMVLIDHGVRAVGVRAVPETAELLRALQAAAPPDPPATTETPPSPASSGAFDSGDTP